MPVRPPCQPGFDCRRLVGGVIVHDDVDVQPFGDRAVDLFQEVEKLPGPVAPVALADDAAGGDIEGGEERGRAVTLVIVRAPLGHARQHRQDRLSAVEGLDLALFVDTEHQGAVRRRQIEPNDVADLVHEERIARQLEGLRAVRLQAEGAPDAPDRRARKAAFPGHRAQRPMGGVRRRRAERPLDNLGHPIVRERSRPSRPRLIRQPLDARLEEAPAPLADRVLVHADLGCYRLVRQAVCAAQDHAAAIGDRARDPAPSSLCLQKRPLLIAQNQRRHRPAHTACHRNDLRCHTPMATITETYFSAR